MSEKEIAIVARGMFRSMDKILMAGAAAFALSVAAPGAASAHDVDISFGDFSIDDDEDFVLRLIALDAADIEALRGEFAEARGEIRDAIGEIEEARIEAREAPGGAMIIKVALNAASAAVSTATSKAFDDARAALDRAERDLGAGRYDISADELAETQGAIAMIRDEIREIEIELESLIDAMRE